MKYKYTIRNTSILILLRLHFSCNTFLPSPRHPPPPDKLLFSHHPLGEGVHELEDRFFENGVEDSARVGNVWGYGGFD